VHDPAVLILDEPFNGMDPRQRLHMMDLLHRMAEAGRTILFSSVTIAAALAALPSRAALPATGIALALAVGGLAYERTLAPPAYDRLAAALVDEGWRLGDPVAFYPDAHELSYFGSSYALRSPVGWYLPGHPMMRLPTTEQTSCERAYVVAPVGRQSALLDATAAREVVGSIAVARIACSPGLEDRVSADGAVWFVSMPPT
jgi:hypothetical protein